MGLEETVMAEEGSPAVGSAVMAWEAAEKEAVVGQRAARATEGQRRAVPVTGSVTHSALDWTG